MAAGRPLGKVEEEAQEALEGLGGSQSKEDGGLRQPGETGRCWEESSATEQTRGGGEGRGWRELTYIFFNESKGKTELRLPVEVLKIFHQGILLERDCVWKRNC